MIPIASVTGSLLMKLPAARLSASSSRAAAGYLKRNCAEAKPAFALKRFGSVRLAILVEQEPLAEADHPCSPDGGISAMIKADKSAALRQATGYSGKGE